MSSEMDAFISDPDHNLRPARDAEAPLHAYSRAVAGVVAMSDPPGSEWKAMSSVTTVGPVWASSLRIASC